MIVRNGPGDSRDETPAHCGILARAMSLQWASGICNNRIVNVKWRSIVSTRDIFANCIVPFKSDFVLLLHRLQLSCYAITRDAKGLSTLHAAGTLKGPITRDK